MITRFLGVVHYLLFQNNRSFSKHDLSPSLCERVGKVLLCTRACVRACVRGTCFKEPYSPDSGDLSLRNRLSSVPAYKGILRLRMETEAVSKIVWFLDVFL